MRSGAFSQCSLVSAMGSIFQITVVAFSTFGCSRAKPQGREGRPRRVGGSDKET